MGAARCSQCGISFPATIAMPCKVCGGPLDLIRDEQPDRDWREQVARRTKDPGPADEAGRVVAWRTAELLRAGYDLAEAEEIAEQVDVDLHVALELLREGCPPETAARILL